MNITIGQDLLDVFSPRETDTQDASPNATLEMENEKEDENGLKGSLTTNEHHSKQLPSFLLTNLRGFGKTGETDKPEYLEEVLSSNFVDVAVLTETWATDSTLSDLDFKDYTMFHSIRRNCKRPSGGYPFLLKNI